MSKRKANSPITNKRLLGLLVCLCAVILLVSVVTHDLQRDTRVLQDSFAGGKFFELFSTPIQNKGGILGLLLAFALFTLLGYLGTLVPFAVFYLGIALLRQKDLGPKVKKIFALGSVLFLLGALLTLGSVTRPFMATHPGAAGIIGYYSARLLLKVTGVVGSYTIVISLILVVLSFMVPQFFVWLRNSFLASLGKLMKELPHWLSRRTRPADVDQESVASTREPGQSVFRRILRMKTKRARVSPTEQPTEEQPQPEPAEATPAARPRRVANRKPSVQEVGGFQLPDLDLMSDVDVDEPGISKAELQATANALRSTLAVFGIELANDEIEVSPGPIITRFEFKPAPGIKISQIVNLADDLALALKAKRVRIVAPIPGKSAVGVEVPNRVGQTVYLKEILASDEFRRSNFVLPLALGKNIAGAPFVVDLAAMPHLLIAGATGSGKSVCLNCIVTSLLFKHSPETLRFIMIDPKMLELTAYNELPHLAKPVVTEIKYAEKTLGEATVEMEERYRKLAGQAVRNIADYNKISLEPLPYIVIVVDELADLMMAGSTRIETLITRLAQMARAVGIHLILATQRPSVDVITGLIKANFSTRIAFQVATKVDSRTILDANGAEKLLGKGDMLYMNPAFPEPIRAHGAYISGEDIARVCKFLADQQHRVAPLASFVDSASEEQQYDPAADALFREAVELVIRHKQGSVSLLQRRLGIGYQRAARLIDQLEEAGIVGPYDGSKARQVLVDEEYLKHKLGK